MIKVHLDASCFHLFIIHEDWCSMLLQSITWSLPNASERPHVPCFSHICRYPEVNSSLCSSYVRNRERLWTWVVWLLWLQVHGQAVTLPPKLLFMLEQIRSDWNWDILDLMLWPWSLELSSQILDILRQLATTACLNGTYLSLLMQRSRESAYFSQKSKSTRTYEFAKQAVAAILRKKPHAWFSHGHYSFIMAIIYHLPLFVKRFYFKESNEMLSYLLLLFVLS